MRDLSHALSAVIVASTLLLALPTPASSQDGTEVVAARTPEGAQRFLASEIPDGLGGDYNVKAKVAQVSSDDVCRTIYRVEPKSRHWMNQKTGEIRTTPEPYTPWKEVWETGKSYDKVIDWSKVRSVTIVEWTYGEEYLSVSTANVPESSALWIYTAKEVRDRVMAAAQFLQEACDMTKGSGF